MILHFLHYIKNLILRFFSWFKHTSKKKKALVVVGILILLFILYQTVIGSTRQPPYTFVKAEKKTIVDIVSESGHVLAGSSVSLYSPATGFIEEIFVKNGDTVEENDDLFSVKSTATIEEKQTASAAYLSAKAAFDSAQSGEYTLRSDKNAKWKAFYDLATSDKYEDANDQPRAVEREAAEFQIAEDNWKAAEKKLVDQQNVISQARAGLAAANQAYMATQDITVKAPASGTVANLAYTLGSSVIAKTLTVPGTPVLAIANGGGPEIVVSLNELDAIKVTPGQAVNVEVTAMREKKYKGVIDRVDSIGTDNQGVIKYNAYIRLSTSDPSLKSGMTSDVEIITKKLENVLSVPNAAVKPYKGGKAVRVLDLKTKEIIFVPVKVGIKGEERTQIISGVEEGQEIISSLSNDQIQRPGLF